MPFVKAQSCLGRAGIDKNLAKRRGLAERDTPFWVGSPSLSFAIVSSCLMDLSATTDLAPSVGSTAALPCSQHSGAACRIRDLAMDTYILLMPGKPMELPPAVARAFVKDMRAFLAEENAIKRDEIAARQLHALTQHYTGNLRLFDVREMFLQMQGRAAGTLPDAGR
jgi:hypothetical protein